MITVSISTIVLNIQFELIIYYIAASVEYIITIVYTIVKMIKSIDYSVIK